MKSKFETIYVICPGSLKTGGTEVAHQLVFLLNEMGAEAKIAYFVLEEGSDKPLCHPELAHYVQGKTALLDDIPDVDKIATVIPESYPEIISIFEHVQMYLWWLSFDNFPKSMYEPEKLQLIYKLMKIRNVKHLVQSEYAKVCIIREGIAPEDISFLSDYLNDYYLETMPDLSSRSRQNLVLYNPLKGLEYVEQLVEAASDIQFMPIMKMTNRQVIDLMHRSKVYIDFGSHPGKDRIPREAAMCGLCVITGRKGSAAYYEDVPLDDRYKISEKETLIPEVVEVIRNCLTNYDEEVHNFDDYREKIRGEKDRFINEIREIFLMEG